MKYSSGVVVRFKPAKTESKLNRSYYYVLSISKFVKLLDNFGNEMRQNFVTLYELFYC